MVTGATGFIGSNLIRRLVKDKNYEVSVIVRPFSDLSILNEISDSFIVYTYIEEKDNMLDIFNQIKPDIVVHLATKFQSAHIYEDIKDLISSNIIFGTKILEAMNIFGTKLLLNVGTSWEHYNSSMDYDPTCLYAATKKAFEDIALYYVKVFNFRIVTLKLFDTFGPNDPRKKLFYLLKNCLKESKPIDFSPGHQEINLLYIDDVIEAFMAGISYLLSGKGAISESYFIASENALHLREVVKVYEAIVGKNVSINWGGRPYRPREVMIARAQLRSTKERLKWKPEIGLAEGIRLMIDKDGLI